MYSVSVLRGQNHDSWLFFVSIVFQAGTRHSLLTLICYTLSTHAFCKQSINLVMLITLRILGRSRPSFLNSVLWLENVRIPLPITWVSIRPSLRLYVYSSHRSSSRLNTRGGPLFTVTAGRGTELPMARPRTHPPQSWLNVGGEFALLDLFMSYSSRSVKTLGWCTLQTHSIRGESRRWESLLTAVNCCGDLGL